MIGLGGEFCDFNHHGESFEDWEEEAREVMAGKSRRDMSCGAAAAPKVAREYSFASLSSFNEEESQNISEYWDSQPAEVDKAWKKVEEFVQTYPYSEEVASQMKAWDEFQGFMDAFPDNITPANAARVMNGFDFEGVSTTVDDPDAIPRKSKRPRVSSAVVLSLEFGPK
jgi:hypothetical protein